MKVGIGIRGDDRSNKNYIQFCSQIGASHSVIFMPDKTILPNADYGSWSVDDLKDLKKFYGENGVKIEGFENFDPHKWYKVLLDLPGKEKQLDYIKGCIANMGKAGIKVMGYNFTLAGVVGRNDGPYARGGATTVRFILDDEIVNGHIPLGWAWNRHVMPDAPEGNLPPVSYEEIMQRRDWFLDQIFPVAEEAGVKMAAHPEDPPIPVIRNTARILTSVQAYDELFAKYPSTSNCIEFCQGTFSEMGIDVYDAIRHFANMDKIGYVHFRNVRGIVPDYTEVFIDEGDMDMVKAVQTYAECGYKGLLMPDHTPEINCANFTETGMAYAIGYIRGIMKALKIDIDE